MDYSQQQVMEAFRVYAKLSVSGGINKEEALNYLADDVVRGLVDRFALEVSCTIVNDRSNIYLVPIAQNSPFHITNDTIKRLYMPAKALNIDIYLMYVTIIVLFGIFYDSYQSVEPHEFVSMNIWLEHMEQRISSLKEYDVEQLKNLDGEYNFNWSTIVNKWEDMDDVKENVKIQDARTNSRVSFLNIVKTFLEKQQLIKDIGNDEFEVTDKAKTIILRYYMDSEYNRGILEFMYQHDKREV